MNRRKVSSEHTTILMLLQVPLDLEQKKMNSATLMALLYVPYKQNLNLMVTGLLTFLLDE
jgi:hypothetical protein